MAVTIQDDMMRAASMLPKTQRAAFLVALLDYGEYGIEPKGKPQWLPTFEACKERVQLSKHRYDKGKQMADARWNKQDAQASCTNADKHHAQASCTDANKHLTENENENEKEKENATTTRARAREGGGGGCMHSAIRMRASDKEIYPTPADALRATYSEKVGNDVGFSRALSVVTSRDACSECDCSEKRVMECAAAAKAAILDWDGEKASTPLGILKAAMRQVDGDA